MIKKILNQFQKKEQNRGVELSKVPRNLSHNLTNITLLHTDQLDNKITDGQNHITIIMVDDLTNSDQIVAIREQIHDPTTVTRIGAITRHGAPLEERTEANGVVAGRIEDDPPLPTEVAIS